ncbi:hypothetical protein SAMN04515647_3682 [Cohaesibacter sp. ES.047]|uniref:hypothetical protein n=1 Tax=Cohaesibacter sp. ES.047 TaxID=1798205 RepID=UPI000BB7518D|nr:hypothetical protein [Cohaesibacter sp. ES.047]SNY93387.1 hypothetical protein SAMN04515647_3682 [Cohaesibacter sp. ES.047]
MGASVSGGAAQRQIERALVTQQKAARALENTANECLRPGAVVEWRLRRDSGDYLHRGVIIRTVGARALVQNLETGKRKFRYVSDFTKSMGGRVVSLPVTVEVGQ